MKINSYLSIFLLVFVAVGCGLFNGSEDTESKSIADIPTNTGSEMKTSALDDKKEEFKGEINFPFDFPQVTTNAKTGDHVLVPSYNWLIEAMDKGGDKQTFIWYAQKMSKPGDETSEIQFMSDRKQVPNAYIIPIPSGAKAKKGDIILTWWQTGSGMQRAIVTDATDPAEPVVRYLDLDYDNPAKSRDGNTTIGKMDEKIKPDTFVVIRNEFEPGTAVAITDGAEQIHGIVIREAGDKMFVRLFAGRAGVFAKSEAKGVPLIPKVKVGDRVRVPRHATFADATVTKVDPAIGRVFVKFDGANDEKAIAYGNVLPK